MGGQEGVPVRRVARLAGAGSFSSASNSTPNSMAMLLIHNQIKKMTTPVSVPYVLLYDPKKAT